MRSWVNTLVDGIVAELRSDQQTGFIPPLVHSVARVTVEEAARRCRQVVEEFAAGKLRSTKWTAHEAEARIRAMLTDEVPRG
jgi:hypothetical protein